MVSTGIFHTLSSDSLTGAGGSKVASYVWEVGADYQKGLSLLMVFHPQQGQPRLLHSVVSGVPEGESKSC